jgi:hypothetical protein
MQYTPEQLLVGFISSALSITLIVLFILIFVNTQKIAKCVCKSP